MRSGPAGDSPGSAGVEARYGGSETGYRLDPVHGTMEEDASSVVVLRLGHRPGRDNRMTTHVGLTARALGADRVILPSRASEAAETIQDITDRFGGPFTVGLRENPASILSSWEGLIVHLTMYGEPVQRIMGAIRSTQGESLLVVVGAGKVSFDIYETADWNVAVTNQPHSEVAALGVFLDRFFEGRELDRDWVDADQEIVPQATGKHVNQLD